MKNNVHADIIEEAMKNAYRNSTPSPEIPETWQKNLMAALREKRVPENIDFDMAASRIFRASWIAAGIAAVIVILFSIFFSPSHPGGGIEDDLRNLYADNSMNELVTDISGD